VFIMSSQENFDFLSRLSDFAVRIDAQGVIQEASNTSKAFLQLPTDLLQESIQLFIQPEDMPKLTVAQGKARESGCKQVIASRLLRQKVLPVWVDCHILPLQDGDYMLIAFDMTHWKENEARLVYLSTHDALTGLPGKELLDDRINTGIRLAQQEKNVLALIVLDLDGFKKINNTLGHRIGDELLKAVAERLHEFVRRNDTLVRIGGDEFSLILMVEERKTVELIVKKILVAVQRPFCIVGHNLHISASLGVAVYPEHGDNSSALYRCAEIAMYRAKSLGKNRWEYYSDQLDSFEHGDLSLESAMHEGIKNGEFMLHYQPVFCARTGQLKGVEALMRWDSSSYGSVSPAKFIPLAESSGLINILGPWALRSACHQVKLWQEAGHVDFYISVNVSPRQFVHKDFLEVMNKALSESGLPPESLMLEITEGVLMDNPQERSVTILTQLRETGVQIAIDDFGTGYSSLAYLKKFPLTVLKIDKSFVDNVANNSEDAAIVTAILGLAKGLGLDVVAEGVENDSQLNFLKEKGCDLIQGYLTGRPVSSENFQEKYIT
jgi:diguanylate cyclase (GGDEF)-like protein